MFDKFKTNKLGLAGIGLILFGLVGAVYSLVPRSHAIPSVPLSQLGLAPDHGERAKVVAQSSPTFRIVGADGLRADQDNAGKNVRLWDAMIKVRGSHLPNVAQEIGDCVSWGAAHAIDYLQAVQIVKQPGSFEFKEAYPPYIYGVSRVIVGRKHGSRFNGDGSVGAYAAEGLRDYGCLRSDADKVPPYSGSVARSWGASGPPKWALDESKPFAIQTFAQVTSAAEARDAICNGYPVTIASGWWGTTKIDVVDGRRVATRNTSWGHQQCLIAYDGTGREPYFYVLNSWGEKAHPAPLQGEPPGGYWIRSRDLDRICSEGDSWALSGFDGFPSAEINWDNLLTRQSLIGQPDSLAAGNVEDGMNTRAIGFFLLCVIVGAVLVVRSRLLKPVIERVVGGVMLLLTLFASSGIAAEPNFEMASVRSQSGLNRCWETASVRASECPWERAACRPAQATDESFSEKVTPTDSRDERIKEYRDSLSRISAMLDSIGDRLGSMKKEDSHSLKVDRRQDAAATVKPVSVRADYSAYAPWYVDGHPTSDLHLMLKHNVEAEALEGLTQDQKDRLHGMLHGEKPKPVPVPSGPAASISSVVQSPIAIGSPVVLANSRAVVQQPVRLSSACPGGFCPTQNVFQVFGRNRRR